MTRRAAEVVRAAVGGLPGVDIRAEGPSVTVRRVDGGVCRVDAVGDRLRWSMPPDPAVAHTVEGAETDMLATLLRGFVRNALSFRRDEAGVTAVVDGRELPLRP